MKKSTIIYIMLFICSVSYSRDFNELKIFSEKLTIDLIRHYQLKEFLSTQHILSGEYYNYFEEDKLDYDKELSNIINRVFRVSSSCDTSMSYSCSSGDSLFLFNIHIHEEVNPDGSHNIVFDGVTDIDVLLSKSGSFFFFGYEKNTAFDELIESFFIPIDETGKAEYLAYLFLEYGTGVEVGGFSDFKVGHYRIINKKTVCNNEEYVSNIEYERTSSERGAELFKFTFKITREGEYSFINIKI